MELRTLDHVALWVPDRETIARFATTHLGMHVIDQADRFTLVGSDARRGKLTLFDADPPRERGALKHVALRVSSLRDALHALPDGSGPEIAVAEGLAIVLVEAPTNVEYDFDHVALYASDPEATAEEYVRLGFQPAPSLDGGPPRVEVGGAFVEFHAGDAGTPERPLLNHLAVLVDSAEDTLADARDLGVDVADFVDAPNTLAVFLSGPDGVKIEYVEHKPSFSLT